MGDAEQAANPLSYEYGAAGLLAALALAWMVVQQNGDS
jgi:hypothetical protein